MGKKRRTSIAERERKRQKRYASRKQKNLPAKEANRLRGETNQGIFMKNHVDKRTEEGKPHQKNKPKNALSSPHQDVQTNRRGQNIRSVPKQKGMGKIPRKRGRKREKNSNATRSYAKKGKVM